MPNDNAMVRAADGAQQIMRVPEPLELEVNQVRAQVQKIQQLMKEVMVEGEHYGVVPGTGGRDGKPPKKTLYKPGAEKLLFVFRIGAEYDVSERWDGEHLSVLVKTRLRHLITGAWMGEGVGYASTREAKYAWRKGQRSCPNCGVVGSVLKSKNPGEGWFCWKKREGCGATWPDGSPIAKEIEAQATDRTPNPDLADTYNTVVKMGCKRSLVAGTLNATAASDLFTQDLEDQEPPIEDRRTERPPEGQKKAAPQPSTGGTPTSSNPPAVGERAANVELQPDGRPVGAVADMSVPALVIYLRWMHRDPDAVKNVGAWRGAILKRVAELRADGWLKSNFMLAQLAYLAAMDEHHIGEAIDFARQCNDVKEIEALRTLHVWASNRIAGMP